MNFSQALDAIKTGARLTRRDWNGHGLFVFLVPGSTFAVNREPLLSIFGEGRMVNYRGHLDLKAVDGSIGVWSPSSTDLLADDWDVVAEDR